MKKTILKVAVIMISSVVFSSCGTSTEELSKQVQVSVEENWKNQGITNIKINDLTLINKVGNEYEGRIEVTKDDQILRYSVDVIADGDNMLWEIAY